MHLATRAFEARTQHLDQPLPSDRGRELRAILRAAALLHDIGHAPLSHASEFAMPMLSELAVPGYEAVPDRQATHEDYTVKIITDSSLSDVLRTSGLDPGAVAALIDPALPVDPGWFEVGGVDWRPLLQQLISSELDVDRMDYLTRDSHFAGVQYGIFDAGWLMSSLRSHVVDGRAHLALMDRAIYTFDDFLIARYHMFLMVYFHYKSMAYEEMLRMWFREGGDGYRLPTDVESYAAVDDVHLTSHLRASSNRWARRITERRHLRLFVERRGEPNAVDLSAVADRLIESGIEVISSRSEGILSKYFDKSTSHDPHQALLPLGGLESASRAPITPIYVIRTPYRGSSEVRAEVLEESTDLFERYGRRLLMSRLYVDGGDLERAARVSADLL
jgi:HD superfamily phosphohydrolase